MGVGALLQASDQTMTFPSPPNLLTLISYLIWMVGIGTDVCCPSGKLGVSPVSSQKLEWKNMHLAGVLRLPISQIQRFQNSIFVVDFEVKCFIKTC